MKIGLFFGSFNPVHTGHLLIASYMAGFTELEKIWLVVSPQNPFKEKDILATVGDRLAMLKIAIPENTQLDVCDAELGLPLPSYTINTLRHLESVYPEHAFYLIMGADTAHSVPNWKEAARILEKYTIYLYPRRGFTLDKFKKNAMFVITNTPLIEISSSFIRKALREGKNMHYWVPAPVLDYITDKALY